MRHILELKKLHNVSRHLQHECPSFAFYIFFKIIKGSRCACKVSFPVSFFLGGEGL